MSSHRVPKYQLWYIDLIKYLDMVPMKLGYGSGDVGIFGILEPPTHPFDCMTECAKQIPHRKACPIDMHCQRFWLIIVNRDLIG